jgi:hypothetical protein
MRERLELKRMEARVELRLLLRVDLVEALGNTARAMLVEKPGESGCVQLAPRHAQPLGNLLRFGEEWIWEGDCCLHSK